MLNSIYFVYFFLCFYTLIAVFWLYKYNKGVYPFNSGNYALRFALLVFLLVIFYNIAWRWGQAIKDSVVFISNDSFDFLVASLNVMLVLTITYTAFKPFLTYGKKMKEIDQSMKCILFPDGLLEYFHVVDLKHEVDDTKQSYFELELLEKQKLPKGYSSSDYKSNGLFEPEKTKNVSVVGNHVSWVVQRRRWVSKQNPENAIRTDLSFLATQPAWKSAIGDHLKGSTSTTKAQSSDTNSI